LIFGENVFIQKCLRPRVTVAVAGLLAAASVHASTITGKIAGWIPYSAGSEELLFLSIDQSPANLPACNTTVRYVIGSSDPRFKGTRAAVIAAHAAGQTVKVVGKGTCSAFSNSEDIAYVCVGNIPC
jgi:hypothetical protein